MGYIEDGQNRGQVYPRRPFSRARLFHPTIPAADTTGDIPDFDKVQGRVSRRKLLKHGTILGAALTLPAWLPPLNKFVHELMITQAPELKLLTEIPPQSVAFGHVPFNNDINNFLRTQELLNYCPPTVNLFHTMHFHGRNERDHAIGIRESQESEYDKNYFKLVKEFMDRGIFVILSSAPGRLAANGKFLLSDILTDEYMQDYLRRLARKLKDISQPIGMDIFYEMNGNWTAYGWQNNSPEDLKLAYRKVVEIFREEGAHNVLFIWRPNIRNNRLNTLYTLDDWNPGTDVFDIAGLSVFDRFRNNLIEVVDGVVHVNAAGHVLEPNWSLKVLGEDLAYLQKLGKPMSFSEMGTMQTGQARAEWTAAVYTLSICAGVTNFNNFAWRKDGPQERDWRFEVDKILTEMAQKYYQQPFVFERSPHTTPEETVERIFKYKRTASGLYVRVSD